MLQGIQPRPTELLWLYQRDGEEFGPTDLGGLQAMADSLHLRPECQVWQRGVPGRILATAVDGIRFRPPERTSMPLDPRYLRIYRSADDRVLLGLCAGLAHRWGLPTTLVRVGMVAALALMVGWAYVFGVCLPALPTRGLPRPGRGVLP